MGSSPLLQRFHFCFDFKSVFAKNGKLAKNGVNIESVVSIFDGRF